MNYEKIYFNIIENARDNIKQVGYEKHHIIPRSCGGNNDKKNLVYLTTREHFVCHLLLVKIYSNNSIFKKKMIYALWWMAKTRHNLNGCRVTGHHYAEIRKKFIENSPNKDPAKRKKFQENYKAGKYNYDYIKVSNSLKKFISTLSPEEKLERMKKSALSGDQQKRKENIKKGKGTQFLLTSLTGEKVTFWSYENVKEITGYRYDQIRYRIKKHNGILENGNVVSYIKRYAGNDKNIGRKRNNRISTRADAE